MKQLQQILKHFTVRVGEDMKVLLKPVCDCNESVQFICSHCMTLSKRYNNALELVQMPRVTEFVPISKEYYFNPEIYFNGNDHGPMKADTLRSILKYTDFAKQAPALWMYIPTGEDGKPMEKPKNYEEWKTSTDGHAHDIGLIEKDEYYICEAYESALAKVLFYGWEYINTDEHGVITIQSKSSVIWNHTVSGEWSAKITDSHGRLLDTLEDAFIACPHYLQLEKLK